MSKLYTNYLQKKVDAEVITKIEGATQLPDVSPIDLLWEEFGKSGNLEHPINLQMAYKYCGFLGVSSKLLE